MYVMLLLGMVVSALIYGALLENYSPGRLIQVIQGSAVVTVGLNMFAMWKQEARDRTRAHRLAGSTPPPFREALTTLAATPGTLRLLTVIALGTLGFGAADVLLEPYGGQVLSLTVAQTTKLTALLAGGTLIGFGIASRVLGNGGAPARLALIGATIGVPGFAAIVLSATGGGTPLFLAGTLATGLGAGLFGHATLTATMRAAPRDQIGLALGTWGAVQATAAGVGVAAAGIVRDLIVGLQNSGGLPAHAPYSIVFMIEIAFLLLACAAVLPLALGSRSLRRDRHDVARPNPTDPNPVEVP